MSYPEILDYIYGLQKFGIKLGLQNMRCFLDLLGHPERDFPSIHIAGTKGKGSTAAMIASILSAHGYRVGLYTSPHLQNFTERFSINGQPIAQERVCEIARELRALLEGELHGRTAGGDTLFLQSITYFEFITAMALRYFSSEKVDVAVVEVGLGGRLDATNVLDPLVSVITNIDYEHTEFLGETLGAIAREKGGIVKKGRPVVSGVVQPGAAEIIGEISRLREAPLDLLGRDFTAESVLETPFVQYLDYRETGDRSLLNLRLPLLGVHQQWNAALALRVCSILNSLGFSLAEPAIREGLACTRWPGRFQVLRYRPAVIVDGAHTPASMEHVLATVKRHFPRKRFAVVLGIMKDKEVGKIVERVVSSGGEIIATEPRLERSVAACEIAHRARELGGSAEVCEDVGEALRSAMSRLEKEDCLLVTGSLFTVGEALTAYTESTSQSGIEVQSRG